MGVLRNGNEWAELTPKSALGMAHMEASGLKCVAVLLLTTGSMWIIFYHFYNIQGNVQCSTVLYY